MRTSYPLSATQRAKLRDADLVIQTAVARRDLILEVILAHHDITEGHVTGLTDEGIEVTTPDPDPIALMNASSRDGHED